MRVAPILFLSFTATRTRSWRWIVPLASLCLALVAMWLFLGGWNSRASGAWDRRLGNLSYGVFLGHFLGTVAMYWIAEYVYTRTGLFGVFEIPDVTEQRLRVSAFVFALIFGCLIYVLFERREIANATPETTSQRARRCHNCGAGARNSDTRFVVLVRTTGEDSNRYRRGASSACSGGPVFPSYAT